MSSTTASPSDVPRGFGKVGDLLGDMLHRSARLHICAFCRTALHGSGPCAVCGARHAPATDAPRAEALPKHAPVPTANGSGAQAVARWLGLVLLPPMLLCATFGLWYADYRSDGIASRAARVGPPAAMPATATVGVALAVAQAMDDGTGVEAGTRHASGETFAASASGAPQRPVRIAFAPKGRAQAAPPDVLAACGARNFLLRAVCVNDFCAQPLHRQHAGCPQAIAQRQIDEQRRNGNFLN